MGYVIFAAIALIVGVILFLTFKNKVSRFAPVPLVIAVIAAVVLTLFGCLKKVPTGHTGIATVFGEVKEQTYEAGLHFTEPWVQIVNMDNRTQKQTMELSCFSSDIQEVSVIVDVNYQISKTSAQTIYREIGVNYFNIIVVPRVQETVKKHTASYTAEKLIAKRGELTSNIEEDLRNELAKYNIELVTSTISNLDFTDAFTNAVEEKQVAEQQKLKAETEKEKAIIDAQAEAEVVKLKAEAAAAAKITEAEAEAKANNLLQESLTDKVLKKMFYDRWNGILPTVTGGSDVMIDIDSLVK